jgi:competence protein ComEC
VTLPIPLAFLAALAAAGHAALPWWVALAPAGVGAAALLVARRPAHVVAGMALLVAALALLRVDLARRPDAASPLARLLAAEQVVAARGVVVAEPVPRERTQQVRLRVDAVRLADGDWRTTAGYAQITVRPAPVLHFDEILEVRGALEPPEASVPPGYAAHLRRQGVDAVAGFPAVAGLGEAAPDPARRAIFDLRERLARALEALLPEPQAALVQGILLGRRATIPRELTEQLDRSGTSHMVAVSGYNVSLAIGLVTAPLGLSFAGPAWRRWLAAALASGALWAFVALVGASGSVLRAAAMAQLALAGHALGRRGTAGALLLWGCAFLAAWQPDLVLDVGWQLSFLGTAGLVWLAPALAARLARLAWLPPAIREALAATVAAQVFVLPVLASTFGRVSVVAPLANVLGLPLVPPIMLGGAAVVVADALVPAAAPLLAALAWVPATALIRIVQWTADLPWAAPTWPGWGAPTVLAYLAGLGAWCWYAEWRAGASSPGGAGSAGSAGATMAGGVVPVATTGGAGGRRARLAGSALAALAALACVAWAMAAPLEAVAEGHAGPGLTLAAAAVPEGSLALVRTADGARVLLGGGPTVGGAAALLGEQLRPWDRTVDVVVLADPREAHVVGLARVLERYRVGLLLDGAEDYPSAAYRQVRDAARRRGVRRLRAEAGTAVAVGQLLTLEILAAAPAPPAEGLPAEGPPAEGPAGTSAGARRAPRAAEPLALRLRWGDFSVLVPGDGSAARNRAVLGGPAPVASTIVLLSERGSRESGVDALLRAAEPELVVVQGTPRAGAPAAPPPAPAQAQLPADYAEPTWHRTATDGALRLEVRREGYRVVGRS